MLRLQVLNTQSQTLRHYTVHSHTHASTSVLPLTLLYSYNLFDLIAGSVFMGQKAQIVSHDHVPHLLNGVVVCTKQFCMCTTVNNYK